MSEQVREAWAGNGQCPDCHRAFTATATVMMDESSVIPPLTVACPFCGTFSLVLRATPEADRPDSPNGELPKGESV